MRFRLASTLLVIIIAAQGSPGNQSNDGNDPIFVLHINQPVDPAFVTISYQVKGEKSDDGYVNFGRGGPYLDMTPTQDIPISLTLPQKDHHATALKAVVY